MAHPLSARLSKLEAALAEEEAIEPVNVAISFMTTAQGNFCRVTPIEVEPLSAMLMTTRTRINRLDEETIEEFQRRCFATARNHDRCPVAAVAFFNDRK